MISDNMLKNSPQRHYAQMLEIILLADHCQPHPAYIRLFSKWSMLKDFVSSSLFLPSSVPDVKKSSFVQVGNRNKKESEESH
jgi:hypothetical protein